MSLTDEEIQELCLDCGLGVVIGDHFKNLARAIEAIAHERGRQQGLMEAASICDYMPVAKTYGFGDSALIGCADCDIAIREHAAKGTK